MSTVFVMGGTGFIGSETVKELVRRGDTVYGLARSDNSANKLKALGGIPIKGDVYDPDAWIKELPEKLDYIINVLGFFNDPKSKRLSVDFSIKCRDKYIVWAEVLVRIAKEKKVKAAVHVTGTTVYEESGVGWVTEKTPLRYTKNGFNRIAAWATKLMVDEMKNGLPIIVAVAPNIVYGDVLNASFEQIFVEPLQKGQMTVVGSGTNYIPTGHVEDVGRAVAFVTDEKYAGEFFLIAGDDSVTQTELLTAIASGLGKKSVPHLPHWLISILGGKVAVEFMTLSQRVDNTKLKQAGFEFKYPYFAQTIPDIMASLVRQRQQLSHKLEPA